MKEDIFDKIMNMIGFKILTRYYRKYKSILLYLFFGGCAFVVSIISYVCANLVLGINELLANIISWILAVLFAFFTNRVWVFQSPTYTLKEFIFQFLRFVNGRVITLIIEEAIIFVFITLLGFDSVLIKIIGQIIVIILNYFISKFIVFKKKMRE